MLQQPIRANGERLWTRLMEMARIGATPAGGCNRQALTDEDKQGRQLFESWCKAAGCSIEHDQMGNIFARRAGAKHDQPPVLIGSHLDTQPTGGKFDGVFGVLAGLEVVESLNDRNIDTEHPIDVVVWTNEEGARFSPAMIGSGVFAGEFDLEYGLSRSAKNGATLGNELQRLYEPLLDDVVVLVHAQRQGLPVQGLFAHVVVDQSRQLGVAQGIEPRRRDFRVERLRAELDECEQCIAINDDRLAVEVTLLRGHQAKQNEQADALNVRLASLETRLLRQFNALDSLLGQLSSTSNFLNQQLNSLPGFTPPGSS